MRDYSPTTARVAPAAPLPDEAIRVGLDRARRHRGRIPGHRLAQATKDCGKPGRALLTRTCRQGLAAAVADPTFPLADLLAIPQELECWIRAARGEPAPDLRAAMREEQRSQGQLDELQWCVEGPHTLGDLHELERRAFAQRTATDRLIVAVRARIRQESTRSPRVA